VPRRRFAVKSDALRQRQVAGRRDREATLAIVIFGLIDPTAKTVVEMPPRRNRNRTNRARLRGPQEFVLRRLLITGFS
jgi:hypothetical protein